MYTQNVLLLKLPWRSGRIGAYRACRWGSIPIGGCLRKNPFFGFAPCMLCNSSFCPLYAFHSFNYRICKHCIIVCLHFDILTTCIIRNKKLYESKVVKTLSYTYILFIHLYNSNLKRVIHFKLPFSSTRAVTDRDEILRKVVGSHSTAFLTTQIYETNTSWQRFTI